MITLPQIYRDRAIYSQTRLTELKNRLKTIPSILEYSSLTVFGAGSYARYEASEYSDIDIFFLRKGVSQDLEDPHTHELRFFGNLIEMASAMGFPKFSNDCAYLKILHSHDILKHLGMPSDDHENYFTVRMLLLLESKCLFGDTTYSEIINEIIGSYFRDYPDHEETLRWTPLLGQDRG